MQKANSCRLLSSAHCMPIRLFLANHQDDPYQMATNKEAKRDIQPVLVHSAALLQVFNTHPKYKGRADLVQSLISAYHLDKILRVVPPQKTEWRDLLTFHSEPYIEFIRNHGNKDEEDLSLSESEEAELYGLNYDCPLFEGLPNFIMAIAASTLTAAEVVVQSGGVAINWYGGWHHAHRDEALGFCYVNDIVLCILKLLDHYQRVLYVDLDIHHGDGIEDAFYHSPRVMNISFHKHAPGFFPGGGDSESVGMGPGQFYTVNVPLRDGLTDKTFHKVFTRVMSDAKSSFEPSAVVVQCGADMLSGDPIGTFSLTPHGLSDSVAHMLAWKLPTVLLGGGGYNFPNTARFWTLCTGLVAGQKLTNEIPEHNHYEHYLPDYELCVSPRARADQNTSKYIDELLDNISGHFSNID